MNDLIKIKDLSAMYDVTARTLRYYEDIGLLSSTRCEDYAHRMYDEAAVRRLKQILILRKLNISIKDIQRIFDAAGSDVVLDVLEKKVRDIDDEVALLHELKEIVLDFIHEIERMNFADKSDIKLLYDKAKDIETQLINVDYSGKPSNVNRLIEITEKLDKKIPDVMIVKIPGFRAVTSGLVPWDKVFGEFGVWQEAHQDFYKSVIFDCPDFLTGKDDLAEWIWGIKDEITAADVAPYNIIEFQGGVYAVAVSVDGDGESHDKVRKKVKKWLETTNFTEDSSRLSMGHMIYPHDDIMEGLGYHQMNLYLPVKLKGSGF